MSAPRVVIIGGGIVGLATAHYCLREGADVVLCERKGLGSGCSGENAGLVVPSHFIPLAAPGAVVQGLRWMLDPESPFYVRPRLDPGLLRWLLHFSIASRRSRARAAMPLLRDLAEESIRLYGELATAEGLDFGFVRRGLLMLFHSQTGEEHAVEEARLAQEIGVQVRILDRTGLERIDPGIGYRAAGATYFPNDAHLDPVRLVAALAERNRVRGVENRLGSEVLDFRLDNGKIRALRTTEGEIEGDEFVLAAGSWSPGLLGGLRATLPMEPGKGYSVTFTAAEGLPSIPSILTEARVAVTPFGNRLRLAGTMELAGMDESVNTRRVEAIVRAVPRYYRSLDANLGRSTQPWFGFRPCTPDGLPYIGRFAAHPNLIAATGHAMIGISLGPITGRIVADLIAGRTSQFTSPLLSPDRYLRDAP